MTRPDFLSQPGTWIRAPRVAQTPVEYADPLDFPAERRSSWEWVDLVIAALAVAVLAGIFGGYL